MNLRHSVIQDTGWMDEWIPDYDEDMRMTGEGQYVKVIILEALGSDDQIHCLSLTASHIADGEVLKASASHGRCLLEESMRKDGVWPG